MEFLRSLDIEDIIKVLVLLTFVFMYLERVLNRKTEVERELGLMDFQIAGVVLLVVGVIWWNFFRTTTTIVEKNGEAHIVETHWPF